MIKINGTTNPDDPVNPVKTETKTATGTDGKDKIKTKKGKK